MSEINVAKEHPYTGKYVLIRTYSSGVHIGYLKEYDFTTRHIYLTDTRRIHYWDGAFTLSAVAMDGIKEGRISRVVPEMMIADVIEIMILSDKAKAQLENYKEHKNG